LVWSTGAVETVEPVIDVRRQLTTVTLALIALIAALTVWAGLAWASGGSVPSPSEVPRIVFTQATDPGGTGGHHCNRDGGGADTTPAPAAARGYDL
jgi:hypothetical protein